MQNVEIAESDDVITPVNCALLGQLNDITYLNGF